MPRVTIWAGSSGDRPLMSTRRRSGPGNALPPHQYQPGAETGDEDQAHPKYGSDPPGSDRGSAPVFDMAHHDVDRLADAVFDPDLTSEVCRTSAHVLVRDGFSYSRRQPFGSERLKRNRLGCNTERVGRKRKQHRSSAGNAEFLGERWRSFEGAYSSQQGTYPPDAPLRAHGLRLAWRPG